MARSRCTFVPYSYTHVELYKHSSKGSVESGDVMITCVGSCKEDNLTCNALRSRLAALSREELAELIRMAERVDSMLDGTSTV